VSFGDTAAAKALYALRPRVFPPWDELIAGQQLHVLAGEHGQPAGFATMEITIPANFAGTIPHAHDQFDEGIYVLRGRLLMAGDGEPQEAASGSMFPAPRGHRHGFSNPYPEAALVLGIWAPSEPTLVFMREIGAACLASGLAARPGQRARNLRAARRPPPALTPATATAHLAPNRNTRCAADAIGSGPRIDRACPPAARAHWNRADHHPGQARGQPSGRGRRARRRSGRPGQRPCRRRPGDGGSPGCSRRGVRCPRPGGHASNRAGEPDEDTRRGRRGPGCPGQAARAVTTTQGQPPAGIVTDFRAHP
jgi:quercetin dioxygenase-like cupin family protein